MIRDSNETHNHIINTLDAGPYNMDSQKGMIMKTKEQVTKEIEALKTVRPNVRPRSMFGDDNLGSVDAQITVLDEYLDEDDIAERFDHAGSSEYVLESALAARQWIDDESESDSLAMDWPLKEGGDTCQEN